MSFAPSALLERTVSVLPAAAHGMLNGDPTVLRLLVLDADPLLSGPQGLLCSLVRLLVGSGRWSVVRRRGTVPITTGAPTGTAPHPGRHQSQEDTRWMQ